MPGRLYKACGLAGRLSVLTILVAAFFSEGQLQAASSDVQTLFNIGRQALTTGRQPVFGDLYAAKEYSKGDEVHTDAALQYQYLRPYGFSKNNIRDTISMHSWLLSTDIYNLSFDEVEDFLRFDLHLELQTVSIGSLNEENYSIVKDQGKIFFNLITVRDDDYGFMKSDLDYGSNWQGMFGAGFRAFKYITWRSEVFYDYTSVNDPGRRYIDSSGNLAFVDERSEESNLRVALFDQFKVDQAGFSYEMLHGTQLWDLKALDYALVKEGLVFSSISSYFEVGYRGLDAWQHQFVEPGYGWVESRDDDDGVPVIQSGLIITPRINRRNGKLHAVTSSLVVIDAGFPMFNGWKFEYTLQLLDKLGREDTVHGTQIGFSVYRDKNLAFEITWSYNYLPNLDLIPGMKGVHQLKTLFTASF